MVLDSLFTADVAKPVDVIPVGNLTVTTGIGWILSASV